MDDLTGQRIDRYEILAPLGEGGMAVVYRALDTRLRREVAVKLIRTDQFPPAVLDQMLRRFEREATALARLQHAGIVTVHDFGEYGKVPYLVMEYLAGGTLRERMLGRVPYARAARWLQPVAEALAYAHCEGIVHRDIKPGNILFTARGHPKLSDFGIVRLLSAADTTHLTGTGLGVGTPAYMAPEQWRGVITPSVDIYALGVVFYELLTGHLPFIADTPAELLVKAATEPPLDPGQDAPDLPPAARAVLDQALAKQPEQRFADMQDMADLLAGLAAADPGTPPVPGLVPAAPGTPVPRDSGSTLNTPTPPPPPPASLPTPLQAAPPPPIQRTPPAGSYTPPPARQVNTALPTAAGLAPARAAGPEHQVPRRSLWGWLGGAGALVGLALVIFFVLNGLRGAASPEPSRTPEPSQTSRAGNPLPPLDTQVSPAALPTDSPAPASDTPRPSSTARPTATALPATATQVLVKSPTATLKPVVKVPTSTPVPPTHTPVPPTNTPRPPTSTVAPPTATPTTAVAPEALVFTLYIYCSGAPCSQVSLGQTVTFGVSVTNYTPVMANISFQREIYGGTCSNTILTDINNESLSSGHAGYYNKDVFIPSSACTGSYTYKVTMSSDQPIQGNLGDSRQQFAPFSVVKTMNFTVVSP